MKNIVTNGSIRFRKRLFVFMMRTFIFLFCSIVFGFNHNDGFSQNVKIEINSDKTISIIEAFEIIKKQTDYTFIYKTKSFENAPKIHVEKGTILAHELLSKALSFGNYTYELTPERTILIKEKRVNIRVLQKEITGVVTDQSGQPLPGTNILEKNTKNGVAANFDGVYSINVSNENAILVFSFIGFVTQEVKVNGLSQLNIQLELNPNQLKEVLVTGYQKISKERSAGSFSKPEMDEVNERSTSMNILQRLDGLIPGLTINNAPNSSNFTTSNGNILIRGLSTINGDSNPLFVVDGVPLSDVSSINPQDVEDVTVLKDATSASIWGAQASNGVIVITTKRGGFNENIKLDYDTFINFQGKPDIDYRPVLNSQQFIQTAKELFDPVAFPYGLQSIYNIGGATKSISEHNQILYDLDNGLIDQTTADQLLNELANTSNVGQIKDLLYRDATIHNHTLSVQGGGEKYAFYASIAYTNIQSNKPDEKDNTYKVNLRQDFKVGKRFNFRINSDITNNIFSSDKNINADNRFTPYALFRDANGTNLSMNALQHFSPQQRQSLETQSDINLDYIPLDDINTGFTDSNSLSIRLRGGLSIDLFKGLKFESTLGYFQGNHRIEGFNSQDAYQVRSDAVFFTVPGANPGDTPTYYLPKNGGYYKPTDRFIKNWTFRNQLIYNTEWDEGKHKLTSLAGYESQEQFFNNRQSFLRGYNLNSQTSSSLDYAALGNGISGTLVSNSFGNSVINVANEPFKENQTTFRYTSFYANAAYILNDKYSVNASWRIDESNLFGVDKSAQNRPVWSVGFKWNISRESFLEKNEWIDLLALRATYGITGNSPIPGSAASFDVLSTGRANPNAFTTPLENGISSPGNKKLTWESTKNLNFGIDFSFFTNRLRGSIDYYNNKTEDLIDELLTNSFTGFTSIQGNVGSLENEGIEFSIQTINIDKEFKWNSSFIVGHNENKITSLNSSNEVSASNQISGRYPRVGYPAFPIFAYDFVGLNNEGSPEIQLSDGTITTDRNDVEFEDIKYMGSFQPKWSGSVINSFSYKEFTLRGNIIYNLGHVMFIDAPNNQSYSGQPLEGIRNNFTTGNVHSDFFNRWKLPGDEEITNIPAYSSVAGAIDREVDFYTHGDINVTSASYIKLGDITLSYSLPKSITDKLNIGQISFRTQLNNVMLWKGNNKGINPEFHDAAGGVRQMTPFNQNSFTLGMHLTF